MRFWHLDSNREHPDVVEAQLAIVSTEDVELALDDISGVSASWPWLELASCYFLPVVALNVKHMDVIHPVDSVVSSEVDDL